MMRHGAPGNGHVHGASCGALPGLRVSNDIALLMLFLGGYYLGHHGRGHPWRLGLITLDVGWC